jgi:predicted RNase H-like HicB family nuclease
MSEYLVVVEKADKNFAAYSPDLPGCAVTAETKAEALKLMRDAIELHIRGLREEGFPFLSLRRRPSISLFDGRPALTSESRELALV